MTNKPKKILSEISAGELLDKISILEIKLEKIKNKVNQENQQRIQNFKRSSKFKHRSDKKIKNFIQKD